MASDAAELAAVALSALLGSAVAASTSGFLLNSFFAGFLEKRDQAHD